MKYSTINKKKLYESPSLRVHKLRFEGALLGAVSAGAHDQTADGPWGAKQHRGIMDDSNTEQPNESYDYDEGDLS